MPMRKGTKVLGPSPEARMAAQDRRSAAAVARAQGSMQDRLDRASRSQGMEAREPMPPLSSGRKKGGSIMKKYAKGGGIESRGKTKGTEVKMACGGSMKKYAKGGSIDGCASKGKTKGKMV